eukprot:TRINITY_DN39874_c0_g1_i1.p1 TRINITY_DN39874_c0_g1~~TRINITY_DN39874_c0_g1_i1.p1  ORF type:complete len:320 (+),score=18.75 TRINITY_DN39874_c0_g1_i1:109-1068(+)
MEEHDGITSAPIRDTTLHVTVAAFCLAAACISGAACVWQLLKMRRVQGDCPKFVECQLWHLAVADLVFAVFSVPYCIASLVQPDWIREGSWEELVFCDALGGLYSTGLNTSILVSCHLAFGFAAAVSQRSGILSILRKSLPWLWLVGALLAALGLAIGETWIRRHRNHVAVHYSCYYSNEGSTFVSIVVGAISFLWCMTCYIICFAFVRSAAEACKARGWRRARLYPAVVIATFGPQMLAQFGLVPVTALFSIACTTLLSLNGFFNTLVYAVQVRFALRTESRYVSIGDLLIPEDLRYQIGPARSRRSPTSAVSNVSLH